MIILAITAVSDINKNLEKTTKSAIFHITISKIVLEETGKIGGINQPFLRYWKLQETIDQF